ncbi:hypothetical protein V5799_011076, partial [Amblyomma americanum]
MNFGKLLNVAEKNRTASAAETTVKRYSTEVAPAKKAPRTNVQSAAIRAFLQRKEEEERRKHVEEQRRKEKLLELRAQNSKSNKRAKVMASRTKDNNFGRIRLTEDEEEARRKREEELRRKMLTDKVERMKARIKLQQEEEAQPHKRKRKRRNSQGEVISETEEPVSASQKKDPHERKPRKRKYELYTGEPSGGEEEERRKPPPKAAPRPAPIVDYHTLLQLANAKQHEPVVIERLAPAKTEESRPLTKQEKERRLEEELHRKGVKVPSKFPPAKRKDRASGQQTSTATVNGRRPPTGPDKAAKSSERAERPDRADRVERAERAERSERPARADRVERVQRAERPERAERSEQAGAERSERSEREQLLAERQRLMEEEERELQEMEQRLAERRKEIARKQRELEEKEV